MTNTASYPVLFLAYVRDQYLSNAAPMSGWEHYGILVAITTVLVFVNYRGLRLVGTASVLIFFVSMAPFVLMVCIGIPKGKFMDISAVLCCLGLRLSESVQAAMASASP